MYIRTKKVKIDIKHFVCYMSIDYEFDVCHQNFCCDIINLLIFLHVSVN